ncbi:GNAT family N-acetyltransferase [Salinibacterium sp. dk2585]|uniref:GNAT family N-acetyltransferase n=1 Tax=unclassified Salinibacterium TaxID=2632331 RepID=UPI0011C2580C|nr:MULTISPECIES: GNAT family N-acetyltransferase [unclassified Salinibacterium]QEE60452.1 GNAT family N-acetyltransferase [Salinibacterium sp. dk2585]TXK55525.1 GNAT family N-acetyltransferase [Salinibacterium sp. dk5596]
MTQIDFDEIEIRELPYEHADSTMLHSAQRAEISAAYGNVDSDPSEPTTSENVTAFVVAYTDGMPAGCGGLRAVADDEFEVKRMYVTPAHRGTGVSTAVLAALEGIARDRGVRRLVLETGDRLPAAIRFYEREGYSRIENFGPYAGVVTSVCYAKQL